LIAVALLTPVLARVPRPLIDQSALTDTEIVTVKIPASTVAMFFILFLIFIFILFNIWTLLQKINELLHY